MEYTDLQQRLSAAVEKYDSQTFLGSFRETTRSSLLNEGLSTRANSLWKMAEFVVAKKDAGSPDGANSGYLVGWRTLASNYNNQTLLLEVGDDKWEAYDAQGVKLGGEEYIKDTLEKRSIKKQHAQAAICGGMLKQLQKIVYGAPGTGKSWEIDNLLKSCPKNVIRTTFHPDSDYSTFVGAYKPTMMTLPRVALVGAKLQKVEFAANVFTDEEKAALECEKKIVYRFVPQAFTKAYVKAWKAWAEKPDDGEAEKVYLVIEEINRGNCAQAFGDIFQLLDRENGYSKYPVNADQDLAQHLKSVFAEKDATGHSACEHMPTEIADGTKLQLPPNLYIWATMNTSDQSLFPMDSAFKRRWDWKYVPIVEGKDTQGNKLGWTHEVKVDGEGKTRNWWDFIRRINIIIGNVTQSEDKKLGYFFAKPKDGGTVIDEETFVNKVVFYLWNEVLKDCPEDDENVAELQLDFEGAKRLPKFVDFFDVENNGEINSKRVKQFLDAVDKVELPQKQEKQEAETALAEAN